MGCLILAPKESGGCLPGMLSNLKMSLSFSCDFRLPCRPQSNSAGRAEASRWVVGISTSGASRGSLGGGHFDQASRDCPLRGLGWPGQHIEISQHIEEESDEEIRNRSEPL